MLSPDPNAPTIPQALFALRVACRQENGTGGRYDLPKLLRNVQAEDAGIDAIPNLKSFEDGYLKGLRQAILQLSAEEGERSDKKQVMIGQVLRACARKDDNFPLESFERFLKAISKRNLQESDFLLPD